MPKNTPDTRLPNRPRDATNTGGLRRSYQTRLYDLFKEYNEKLQPRINRLLNRTGDQGFVKELSEKMNDTQDVTINAGAPKIINEHINRSFKRGKEVATSNPRLTRESIVIPSKLSRTDYLAIEDLKTRNFGLIKNASDSIKNQLLVTITDGIRQGKGTNEIARDIRNAIYDIGKTRSTMIARTEIAYSYNSAIAKTYQDADIEKWQWLSALGENTCEECSSRHGNIYEWDDEQPPIHPNCLCTLYPIVDRGFEK